MFRDSFDCWGCPGDSPHGFTNLPAVVRHEFDVIEPILIQSSFSLPDAKSRINSSLLLVIQMLVNSAFLNEKYFQVKTRPAHCVRQFWQMPAKAIPAFTGSFLKSCFSAALFHCLSGTCDFGHAARNMDRRSVSDKCL